MRVLDSNESDSERCGTSFRSRVVGTIRTEAGDGARRGSERVYTFRFHQGIGTIDRQAGVSASPDRRAGTAARRPGADHRISAHDLRRRLRPNPRSSPSGDRRTHQTNRSQRRCPGRTARPGARRQERFRSPPAERARQPAAGLGARARSPSPRHQCRRRDHRRTSPRLCQQPGRRHSSHRCRWKPE